MDLLQQTKEQYPVLQDMDIHGVESYGQHDGYLEFWPEGEPGTTGYERPEEIPIDSIGVQVFDKETSPKDVLADITSHHLIKQDPKIKESYNQFLNSITPKQKLRLKKDYKHAKENFNENRDYETWLNHTRLPAYFRGYTFDQWSPDFTSKVFTPEQIQIFDNVRKYLGVDPAETGSGDSGKSVLGYKVREPYQSELNFLKKRKDVGGMAAQDGKIIINPYSPLSPEEKEAVAKNEAIRLWMRDNNVVPVFKLTSEQKEKFKDTAYGKPGNEKFLKQTIVARILTGDPSAIATKQQIKQATKIWKQIQDAVSE